MASVVCFGSARFPFCGVAPRSSGVVRSTSPGRGALGASAFSRSPSSLPAGEVDDSGAVVRLQRSSPSSCEHAEAEKGNFPSTMISSVAFKDAPAPENTAGIKAGAAVALRSDSKYSVFYRCEFKGYEDTLLAKFHRQFYRECVISGTVDFIFGNAKAVFQSCLLLARHPLAGKHNVITAQGRDDGKDAAGFSFQNCTVTSRENLKDAETYLGRPWRNHSHVVFMQSFMDGIVHPRGWVPWNKPDDNVPPTVYYGEYGNTGPGANLSQRVHWLHVMNAGEAANYTVHNFIRGDDWLKATGVLYQPGL